MEHLAFTREVGPSIHRCELTHLAAQPIDLDLARAQHDAYEACLRDLGCTVRRLPPEPEHPDAVFVEDTAVVLDDLAVLARPGAASRRGEVASMAEALAPYRSCGRIEPPGTLDGGDVLVLAREVYVGLSSRTNAEGIAQLRRLLEPHRYRVHTVFVTGCLHLKSAVTQVGPETLLLNPAWVDREAFPGLRSVAIDPGEPFGANALLIGTTVVYPSEHSRTAERLAAAGIEVRPVETSEAGQGRGRGDLLLRAGLDFHQHGGVIAPGAPPGAAADLHRSQAGGAGRVHENVVQMVAAGIAAQAVERGFALLAGLHAAHVVIGADEARGLEVGVKSRSPRQRAVEVSGQDDRRFPAKAVGGRAQPSTVRGPWRPRPAWEPWPRPRPDAGRWARRGARAAYWRPEGGAPSPAVRARRRTWPPAAHARERCRPRGDPARPGRPDAPCAGAPPGRRIREGSRHRGARS